MYEVRYFNTRRHMDTHILKKCGEWGLHYIHDLQRIKLRPLLLQHTLYSGEEQEGYMSC